MKMKARRCFTNDVAAIGFFRRPPIAFAAAVLRKALATGCGAALAGAVALLAWPVSAANILWVSDVGVPGTFTGAGNGFTDQGFVTLLQNAGYNVSRFNPSNANTVALTPTELATINAADLIVVGRGGGSGSWQNQRAIDWNRLVTRPLICMSPYFVRPDGARLGWFNGGTLPDDVPAPLTPGSAADPTVDYIFQDVAMNGTNTAELYAEPMDRNTSHIQDAPVAGAVRIATVTAPQEGSATIVTVNAIVGFPAGTAVRGGADILPAYRMYFSGGTRESAAAPNQIWLYTGRENLTPAGEKVFLRAVEVALNNGVAPGINVGPPAVVSQPIDTAVTQGREISFFVAVTGAAPRVVQWQQNDGSGTFTNIPDTASAFARSQYSLPAAAMTDDGAQFRVVVSNALGVVTSDVAQLTVTLDAQPPTVLSAGSIDGTSVVVCFDEAISPDSALEESNYQFNSGTGPNVLDAAIRPDGKSVHLVLAAPLGSTALLDVSYIGDAYGNVPDLPTSFTVSNLGLTSIDVGAVSPPGASAACSVNEIEISAGGLDIGSTADILRLAYRTVTGDFDARVRVVSFVGTNDHFETTAKALLVARESTAANAASVNVWVTPAPPGDNTYSASARLTAGAATNSLGASVTGVGYPNAWMRIKREANLFTTYRSNNGQDWTVIGSTTAAISTTLNVGLGAVSHRNGKLVTATFGDFRISQGPDDIEITEAAYTGGTFTASFLSENGVVYTVEYKESLATGDWNTLTTIPGDGGLKTFTDSAVSPTGARFYRVIVAAVP
jgi:hypothetical protein